MILIGALGLLILTGLYGGSILERNRRIAELQGLRVALDQARFSADSCKVALSWEEDGFLAFDRLVDSLRAEVESYEDPDRGGVPHAEYEAYLEAHPIGDYTVDETTADSDDEMESWGDVHEEGRAPAEDGGEES